MTRVLSIAALVLAAALLAAPASAQVRIQPYGGVPRPVLPPKIILIKPSQAVRIALQAMPKAKPLGVQLRNGQYLVKLKQNNAITLLRINAANGVIQ